MSSGAYKKHCCALAIQDGLKPVIFVGKCIGVFYKSVNVASTISSPVIRKRKLVTYQLVYTLFLGLYYFLNFFLRTARAFSPTTTTSSTVSINSVPQKIIHFINLIGGSWTIFFIFAYLNYHTDTLRKLIEQNQKMICRLCSAIDNEHHHNYNKRLFSYPNFCWSMLIIILMYCTSENIWYDYENFKRDPFKKAAEQSMSSFLKTIFMKRYHIFEPILPTYHPIFTVIFCVYSKYALVVWIYGNVLVIVICKALIEALNVFERYAKEKLVVEFNGSVEKTPSTKKGNVNAPYNDDELRERYIELWELMESIGKFLCPLILSCYGMNVFLIVIKMYNWIAPNSTSSAEETIYNYFAFLTYLVRVFSVTYFVAEVNQAWNRILHSIQDCSNSMYNVSVERLERAISSSPCGITIFGSFVITRSFFISIISFICTTEIIILQAKI